MATGVRYYVVSPSPSHYFIRYLPTSFIAANSAGLFLMVTRKLKVKRLEVPFFQVSKLLVR